MQIKKEILIDFIVTVFLVMCYSSNVFAEEEITRVTIFAENLNLIEQTKMVKLDKGINRLIFGPVSKKIILDSVYPQGEGCEFLEQEYVSDSLLSWKVRSEIEGGTLLRISYLATGLTWKLNYQVQVGREAKFMDLSAWANIENKSGVDFSYVYLTLAMETFPEEVKGESSEQKVKEEPSPQSFFPQNSFSYSIPYPVTLKDGEKKRILLFSRPRIPVKKIFLFDGDRYGEEVREELVFENSQESGLGDFLPSGEIYIYKINSEDKMVFVGKNILNQVLPQGKGSIYLGRAKGIKVEKVQTFYQQLESGEKEYSYIIVFYNFRDLPVKIKAVEHFYGEWEILESHPSDYMKADNLIIYEIEIPANGKQEIKYKARTK